jgi:hypothetical protein
MQFFGLFACHLEFVQGIIEKTMILFHANMSELTSTWRSCGSLWESSGSPWRYGQERGIWTTTKLHFLKEYSTHDLALAPWKPMIEGA